MSYADDDEPLPAYAAIAEPAPPPRYAAPGGEGPPAYRGPAEPLAPPRRATWSAGGREGRELDWELRRAQREEREGELRNRLLAESIAALSAPRPRPPVRLSCTPSPEQDEADEQLRRLRRASATLASGSARRAHAIVTGRIPPGRVEAAAGELRRHAERGKEMERAIARGEYEAGGKVRAEVPPPPAQDHGSLLGRVKRMVLW
ncbi:hypothetical protein DFJ74DRAFT_666541 [Hyaloraphidium curvatum]|nr:hypothetical protein DFJ74DRAFT_666541 [Hyaloraphidium curvatum]